MSNPVQQLPSSPADISGHAAAVARQAREAARTHDPLVLERLEVQLSTLEELAREGMQERYRDRFDQLATRLESDHPLDDQDHRFLALLLTGAATAYLRSENDVDSWRREIERLAGLLEEAPTGEGDDGQEIVRYLHVQGAVEEARRVVPDLRFFLEQGANLEKFRDTTATIEPEERPMLARLVRELLRSPRR